MRDYVRHGETFERVYALRSEDNIEGAIAFLDRDPSLVIITDASPGGVYDVKIQKTGNRFSIGTAIHQYPQVLIDSEDPETPDVETIMGLFPNPIYRMKGTLLKEDRKRNRTAIANVGTRKAFIRNGELGDNTVVVKEIDRYGYIQATRIDEFDETKVDLVDWL